MPSAPPIKIATRDREWSEEKGFAQIACDQATRSKTARSPATASAATRGTTPRCARSQLRIKLLHLRAPSNLDSHCYKDLLKALRPSIINPRCTNNSIKLHPHNSNNSDRRHRVHSRIKDGSNANDLHHEAVKAEDKVLPKDKSLLHHAPDASLPPLLQALRRLSHYYPQQSCLTSRQSLPTLIGCWQRKFESSSILDLQTATSRIPSPRSYD